MFQSLNEKKLNYTNKVVEHIQGLILSGELKPEAKLPAERELAQMMDVSRPTVREALKILSALGFLQIKHGQGVYVLNHENRMLGLVATFFNKKESMLELMEMRKVIEPQAAYWAAERATEEEAHEISEHANESYERVLDKEDDIAFLEKADQDFHYLIGKSTHNAVYMSIMNHLIVLLKTVRMHTLQIPGRSRQSLQEHQAIAQAIRERHPEQAGTLMLHHLESVEHTLTDEIVNRGGEA